MKQKYYTPEDVRAAYNLCVDNKFTTCVGCPFNGAGCMTILNWREIRAESGAVTREEVLAAACEKVCDPLYLDLLKATEA
jgi:hypothetical protein